MDANCDLYEILLECIGILDHCYKLLAAKRALFVSLLNKWGYFGTWTPALNHINYGGVLSQCVFQYCALIMLLFPKFKSCFASLVRKLFFRLFRSVWLSRTQCAENYHSQNKWGGNSIGKLYRRNSILLG